MRPIDNTHTVDVQSGSPRNTYTTSKAHAARSATCTCTPTRMPHGHRDDSPGRALQCLTRWSGWFDALAFAFGVCDAVVLALQGDQTWWQGLGAGNLPRPCTPRSQAARPEAAIARVDMRGCDHACLCLRLEMMVRNKLPAEGLMQHNRPVGGIRCRPTPCNTALLGRLPECVGAAVVKPSNGFPNANVVLPRHWRIVAGCA